MNLDATRVKVAAIYEIDVLPAIVIKICDAYPWAELLAVDGDSLVAFKVSELDSGLSVTLENWTVEDGAGEPAAGSGAWASA